MGTNKELNWMLDVAEEKIKKFDYLFTPETRVCIKRYQKIYFGKIKKIKRRWGALKLYVAWDEPVPHTLSLNFLGRDPVLPPIKIDDSFLVE